MGLTLFISLCTRHLMEIDCGPDDFLRLNEIFTDEIFVV